MQAEMALLSKGFCEIDWQTLEVIITQEALNTKEAVVFKAMLNWAEAECKWQDLPSTPRNKRHVLGPVPYLVRIPTMTLEEFANSTAQSDILMLEETHNIFLCIQFAADRRVFVAGLGLYGSSSGKAKYSVKIKLKCLGVVLAQNLTRFVSNGSSSTFLIWFEHPVQVEQDTFYMTSTMLDVSKLSYFGQEGLMEVQCRKVTFQFQCSSNSTNSTRVQGRQIPKLIFYA
ncbi:BTB/POZ domain-containing protein 6 [Myotis davidii]|uniref:BTB/POZ domain-containing protein 6 n=1 Tax=Myotis davidii TaxID=225400 RepID=L5LP70_MYODS|nr:BTB/POZ domain-containing protein 6 [Myotis davidii]